MTDKGGSRAEIAKSKAFIEWAVACNRAANVRGGLLELEAWDLERVARETYKNAKEYTNYCNKRQKGAP